MEFPSTGCTLFDSINISFCKMGASNSHTTSYYFINGAKGKLTRISIFNNTVPRITLTIEASGTVVSLEFSNFVLNHQTSHAEGMICSAEQSHLTLRECYFLYNTATIVVINLHIGWNSVFMYSNGAVQQIAFSTFDGTLDFHDIGPNTNEILSLQFTNI
jgi:hypothetical protein